MARCCTKSWHGASRFLGRGSKSDTGSLAKDSRASLLFRACTPHANETSIVDRQSQWKIWQSLIYLECLLQMDIYHVLISKFLGRVLASSLLKRPATKTRKLRQIVACFISTSSLEKALTVGVYEVEIRIDIREAKQRSKADLKPQVPTLVDHAAS